MDLRAFVRTDHTAASTISVLFFLAAIVLFGVAISGLLMGTSQQASTAPEVTLGFNGDVDRLTILHAKGGQFQASQVTVRGTATDFAGGDSVTWAQAPNGEPGTVEKGDSIVLGAEADRRYRLTQGRLEVVWHDSDTDQSIVIEAFQVKKYNR